LRAFLLEKAVKLTIEINDETLKQSISNQLQEAVSRLVHERIEEHVQKIMATKLERADNVIEKAAKELLNTAITRSYRGIDRFIDAAALAVVKEKMK
jgi:hypothetical protein